MSAKRLTVLACVAAFISLALFIPPAAADDDGPDPPLADESAAVKLHFKGQGFTTVPPKAGNSTEEEASAPGRNFGARRMGTMIGEWTFTARADFQIQGAFGAGLWASSDKGAKGVTFRLNVNLNGNNKLSFFSEQKDVSTPVKFSISDTATLSVPAGAQVGIGLVWISDPNHFVGPSSGGDFLYSSSEHDSFITVTLAAAPIAINLTKPVVEKDAVRITATLNESLGMDPTTFVYRLAIVGPATPKPDDIAPPIITSGDNGTTVSWLWSWKKSRASSGMYTLTASASYDGNLTYSIGMQVQIVFTQTTTTIDVLKSITGGNPIVLPIIIIVVAVAGGGGGFAAYRWSKKKKARAHLELSD